MNFRLQPTVINAPTEPRGRAVLIARTLVRESLLEFKAARIGKPEPLR